MSMVLMTLVELCSACVILNDPRSSKTLQRRQLQKNYHNVWSFEAIDYWQWKKNSLDQKILLIHTHTHSKKNPIEILQPHHQLHQHHHYHLQPHITTISHIHALGAFWTD